MEDSLSGADDVAAIARERFGLPYLHPLQRMVIANILDAASEGARGDQNDSEAVERSPLPLRQLVLFPTGFGKSICFQLPSAVLRGGTLVIYPLLALMADQERRMKESGINCSVFRGGMREGEWEKAEAGLKSGEARIAIANPESLENPRLLKLLSSVRIDHVAVDEAHCVSEWGETFRPAYLGLGEKLSTINFRVISAFTATASPVVSAAIQKYLFKNQGFSLLTSEMDRSNIRYSVQKTLVPIHTLVRLVAENLKPLIVFDQSRAGVMRICEILRARTRHDCRFYHAGLEKDEKSEIEKWFFASKDGILVSTCAYGLGMDKKNIRTVVHFQPPQSIEAYLQESGRGGRDGQPSRAILIRPENGDSVFDTGGGAEAKSSEPGSPGSEFASREARMARFLEYGSQARCRRSQLLELVGASLDSPCSGCDVCEGQADEWAEGVKQAALFFKANPRRFDFASSVRLLGRRRGSPGPIHTAEPPACAYSGILGDWEAKDISTLIKSMLQREILVHKGTKTPGSPIELNPRIALRARSP